MSQKDAESNRRHEKLKAKCELAEKVSKKVLSHIMPILMKKWTPAEFAKLGAKLTKKQMKDIYIAVAMQTEDAISQMIVDGEIDCLMPI